jgi:hypothetical protein
MSARNSTIPVSIAAIAGAGLWYAAAMTTGRREPWDATAFWVAAYPAAILTCALLGYRYPERAWRWALVLFASQFLAMCVRNGELGSLWPLGMALFGIVALPGVVVARFASRFGAPRAATVDALQGRRDA